MPNNFRLTGDYYVSKKGSDSDDGLTPDTPKLTLQAGLDLITTTGKTLIVGAGVYKEAITRLPGTGISYTVQADGYVVAEGNGSNQFEIGSGTSTVTIPVTFIGFEFRNYQQIRQRTAGNSNSNTTFERCVIKNNIVLQGNNASASVPFVVFINSIVINCTISASGTGSFRFFMEQSIFINSVCSNDVLVHNTTNAKSCYWDSSSSFRFIVTTTGIFDYNNVEGAIRMTTATTLTTGTYQDILGNYYDLSLAGTGGSGTIGDPYYRDNTAESLFNMAVHRILWPTENVNSFSKTPKFNNVANLNFSLQIDSPHIRTGEAGVNIGGTEYAKRMAATYANVSLTNLEFSGNDLVVSSGFSNGTAVFEPYFLQWPLVRPLDKILYEGLLAFNKSETAGGAENQQVPDSLTYNTGAGSNPDRLSVQFRFSTQQDEPATSGEWDNGGYVTAGDYVDYEIDSKPQIDAAGKGNGHPDFNGAGSVFDLIPSWVQVKIILRRDDYV